MQEINRIGQDGNWSILFPSRFHIRLSCPSLEVIGHCRAGHSRSFMTAETLSTVSNSGRMMGSSLPGT